MMTRKSKSYLKGRFEHRRTEGDYLGVMLEAVTLDDWRGVVTAAVTAAKGGDAAARAWLAQYLMGKPAATAPAPLTVVFQQLSGSDPLVNELAQPHIERLEYPSMHADDPRDDAVRELIANELRVLEAKKSTVPETSANAVGTEVAAEEHPGLAEHLAI